jgi:cytochrome c oxidase cbb3-type subunit I
LVASLGAFPSLRRAQHTGQCTDAAGFEREPFASGIVVLSRRLDTRRSLPAVVIPPVVWHGEEHSRVGDSTMSSATIDTDLAAGRAASADDDRADDDRATAGIVYAYTASAAFWLLVASAYGTLAACKLVWPDLLPFEWLSFGRIRPIHTASVLLGWLSVGLTGIAYLVVYRTARRALFSNGLAHAGLWLLNLALFAGLVTLSLGITRGPVEYREWLTPIAAVFAAGALLNGGNIFVTLLRRRTEELYIADWFILGAFTWLPILYGIGYLPAFDRGIGNVVIQAYYMHVVLGLWFTPLVLGVTYWALPRMLHKPIYSYALGVLAFWANLVFYPLIGAHHFVFAPLPWWLQTTAIATGIGMMIPVVASSGNFLLTMKGSWRLIRHEPAVWFIAVGAASYLAASLQGSLQAFRSANALLHFTNHTVGHAHFAAYGFVSFLLFGAVYGLVPRITGAQDASMRMRLHFWLALGGMALYVLSMVVAGVLQGMSWADGRPFIESVVAIKPWYAIRAVGGGLMTLGHVVFAWNLWLMRPQPRAAGAWVSPAMEAAR